MSLSETQSRAVAHGAGPCICLAGPGSGKTTVITERTKYLIEKQKVLPAEILVITFTKAASIEMRERFRNAMAGVMRRSRLVRFMPYFLQFSRRLIIIRQRISCGRRKNTVFCGKSQSRWSWRSRTRTSFLAGLPGRSA